MSQADFPEHYPFALDASFLPCAPGLVCPDPGKTLDNILFSRNSARLFSLRYILLLTRCLLVRKVF